MTDNMHRVDTTTRFFRIFNVEVNEKLRKESLDFRFKRFESMNTLGSSLRVIFTIIIEE